MTTGMLGLTGILKHPAMGVEDRDFMASSMHAIMGSYVRMIHP